MQTRTVRRYALLTFACLVGATAVLATRTRVCVRNLTQETLSDVAVITCTEGSASREALVGVLAPGQERVVSYYGISPITLLSVSACSGEDRRSSSGRGYVYESFPGDFVVIEFTRHGWRLVDPTGSTTSRYQPGTQPESGRSGGGD